MFFTTDLDARLFHPREQDWARNLIVASSFGLTLADELQRSIAPFRDSYQTAAYLATLMLITDVSAVAKDPGAGSALEGEGQSRGSRSHGSSRSLARVRSISALRRAYEGPAPGSKDPCKLLGCWKSAATFIRTRSPMWPASSGPCPLADLRSIDRGDLGAIAGASSRLAARGFAGSLPLEALSDRSRLLRRGVFLVAFAALVACRRGCWQANWESIAKWMTNDGREAAVVHRRHQFLAHVPDPRRHVRAVRLLHLARLGVA